MKYEKVQVLSFAFIFEITTTNKLSVRALSNSIQLHRLCNQHVVLNSDVFESNFVSLQ